MALLGLLLAACGPRNKMEGAGGDTDVGEVSESAEEPTGKGDTASFGQEEEVEKVDEYTVQRGDNLWDIASKRSVYGSGWLYPLIVKANQAKIKDANQLKTGVSLKIPRGLSAAEYDIAREEAMASVWVGASAGLPQGSAELAGASALQAPAPAPVSKPRKKSGGKVWIWALLLALAAAGVGAWVFLKRRQSMPDAGAQ